MKKKNQTRVLPVLEIPCIFNELSMKFLGDLECFSETTHGKCHSTNMKEYGQEKADIFDKIFVL